MLINVYRTLILPEIAKFKNRLFSLQSIADFEALAMELFHYQAQNNPVYGEYLSALGKCSGEVRSIAEIPFMPISFFKTHEIITGSARAQEVFTSSGTGGVNSRHFVADLRLYEWTFSAAFQYFYGPVQEYCVLALLPAYLEREGSSLVYMADYMIRASSDPDSGFYLRDLGGLYQVVMKKIQSGAKVLLLGVSFALLDFAERYSLPENNLLIMETGGMKGRRREMIRSELHSILARRLGVSKIHSEYGMTELLSQAYSLGYGKFRTPPWMKVLIRDTDDPFTLAAAGKTGGINVIDLANLNSCCFIETQDLGRWHPNGEFEVMGRFDNSDIRGCNLLVI